MSVHSFKSVGLDETNCHDDMEEVRSMSSVIRPDSAFGNLLLEKLEGLASGQNVITSQQNVITSTLNTLASDQEEVRRRLMRLETSPGSGQISEPNTNPFYRPLVEAELHSAAAAPFDPPASLPDFAPGSCVLRRSDRLRDKPMPDYRRLGSGFHDVPVLKEAPPRALIATPRTVLRERESGTPVQLSAVAPGQGVNQPFLTALDEVRPGQRPHSEGFEPGSYSRGSARGMTDVNPSYPPPRLAETEIQVRYIGDEERGSYFCDSPSPLRRRRTDVEIVEARIESENDPRNVEMDIVSHKSNVIQARRKSGDEQCKNGWEFPNCGKNFENLSDRRDMSFALRSASDVRALPRTTGVQENRDFRVSFPPSTREQFPERPATSHDNVLPPFQPRVLREPDLPRMPVAFDNAIGSQFSYVPAEATRRPPIVEIVRSECVHDLNYGPPQTSFRPPAFTDVPPQTAISCLADRNPYYRAPNRGSFPGSVAKGPAIVAEPYSCLGAQNFGFSRGFGTSLNNPSYVSAQTEPQRVPLSVLPVFQPKIPEATQIYQATNPPPAPYPPPPLPPVPPVSAAVKFTTSSVPGPTAVPEKHRSLIKLPSYNGRAPLDVFLRKFEVCAKNNGWSESEKLCHLQCALVEPASNMLCESDVESITSADALIEKLKTRFGNADQISLFLSQLTSRKQRDNEDIASFSSDLRRLTCLAFPGTPSPHSEMIAIRSFTDGLIDREIASKIYDRDPPTLDKAYALAVRLEAYKKSDPYASAPSNRQFSRVKKVQQDTTVTDVLFRLDKRFDRLEHLDKRLDRLEKASKPHITPLMSVPVPRAPQSLRNSRNPGYGMVSDRREAAQPERMCWDCSSNTHIRRSCPYRQGPSARVTAVHSLLPPSWMAEAE